MIIYDDIVSFYYWYMYMFIGICNIILSLYLFESKVVMMQGFIRWLNYRLFIKKCIIIIIYFVCLIYEIDIVIIFVVK